MLSLCADDENFRLYNFQIIKWQRNLNSRRALSETNSNQSPAEKNYDCKFEKIGLAN